MVGAVVGNVIADASRPSSDRPAPTLNKADTSGIAAAISDPNMNSSSASAQISPMSSEVVSLVCWPMLPAFAP